MLSEFPHMYWPGYEGDGIAQGLKAGLAEDQAKAVSISTSAKGSGRGFRMTEPKCRRLKDEGIFDAGQRRYSLYGARPDSFIGAGQHGGACFPCFKRYVLISFS